MAFRCVLLILPALALANINVKLSGNLENYSTLKVRYDGNDIDIISDTERNTFSLHETNLKNAVNINFGKRPDDAYLRSPTPWGDLYLKYDWQQVKRILEPQKGEVMKISSEPKIVLQRVFENNSSKTATFNVGITHQVRNTVSSSWTTEGKLSIGKDISYIFKIAEAGGETSFSYTSPWGQNTEQSHIVTVGATSVMEMVLGPGQAVIAKLQVTRRNVQVQMEYEASLYGQTAVNYRDIYKNHYFHALDIGECMSNAGLSNQKVSQEVINIGFCSNSKVIVQDQKTGNILKQVSF